MARTIKEIATTIKEFFISLTTLQNLYDFEAGSNFDDTFSDVSVEANLVNIVATEPAAIENIFDSHKNDVTELIENERIGQKGWYELKAKSFQYGFTLPEESDEYEDTTSEEAIDAKIVTAAWAGEYGTNGVKLKVVKLANVYTQLEDNELDSFTAYMNRVKPAGIALNIISEAADQLGINVDIYYDPLLMNSDGSLIIGGTYPVIEASNSFLNSLDFNGEFITAKLCDTLQAAVGVKVPEIKSVSYKHVGYDFVPINAKYTPESGYLTFDESDTSHVTINYIANV